MNKKYIIIVALIVFSTAINKIYAQEQLGIRGLAKKYYNQYQYFQAIPFLQKLVDTKKPLLADMEQLADCYFQIKDYQAAENWYSRIIVSPKSEPENLIRYGEVLKSNLKYSEAKKALQQYAVKTGDQARVATVILGCDSALVWLANPSLHQLKNESGINTKLSEFSVFPYQKKVFYIGEPDTTVSKSRYGRTGHTYLRIFTAEQSKNNTLSNPILDSSTFNKGLYHVGPIVSNKSESVLYVTRTTSDKKLAVNEIDKVKYLTNNLELYSYKNNNGTWEEKPFTYNDVAKYSVGHAALSADEKVLYFVSNMPGGLGGTDIWFCDLQADGSWSKPQNAGKNINTNKDEMFPFVSSEGVLYFSSNGWPGMGGLDIFTANGSRENWTKAINLRYPLNSSADDFGYFVSSYTKDTFSGYISSNRKGGKGGDDIYSFTYQKPKLLLAVAGNVVDKKTGEIIPTASVTLFSAGRVIVARQSSNANGKFLFELDKDKDYTIIAEKSKFKSDTTGFTTNGITKSDTLLASLKLETLFEVGKVFKLNDINYDFDKDNIRADAASILDGLVVIMRENPTLAIELGSHTDSRGADKYNLNLSQRRAQAVVNYLVAKGISRDRMTAKGYGETQLLNSCGNGINCSDAQHQENRRTEFKVLKY